MPKIINLTKGYQAIVDDDDYDLISKFTWRVNINGKSIYAVRQWRVRGDWQKRAYISMHRQIMGQFDSLGELHIDHINGDGLDNRKENLRICDASNNLKNKRKSQKTKNTYKGVYKSHKKWMATITSNGQRHYLGSFSSEKDAAEAYDAAAKKYHKEYCNINFPNNLC